MSVSHNKLSLNDWMSEAGITKWISALSITDAPIRRAGVRTALQFFQKEMFGLPPNLALAFLTAMDLSRAVSRVQLGIGEKVIAFRTRIECEYKLFYARAGASMYRSGINANNRIPVQYTVSASAPTLVSYTTGAIDVWTIPAPDQKTTTIIRAGSTGVMTDGGGLQLIIPNAPRCLAITRIGT